ncbi:MAG: phosphatase PAP2 family protein [Planctomycetaceae bacterium]|nr:MAG: phosphatase PAP2 family protein [Planctomycetaceae bacterium]
MRIHGVLTCLAILGGCAVARGGVIIEWNDTYLDVTRLTGGAPCPISRAGPLLNVAMYDAVNAIDRVINPSASYQSYQKNLPVPSADSSREAAAAAAAYTVMSTLHQSDAASLALIQSRYNAQVAAIADGAAKTQGLSFGQIVGNSLLGLRANDGYNADPSYIPGGNAGDWRVTPDGPVVEPYTPHWGNVQPWGLQSGSQFRPTRLTDFGTMQELLQSSEYAAQINGAAGLAGVKDVGSRFSTTRTVDETEAAWFWANDRDGTSKPPGQLIQITQTVALQEGLDLSQTARLFGLVGLALGDACVAAWDSKYSTPIDLWRPIDAIRETLDDGNSQTIPDPGWLPLNDFTPPFPAYVSGHATFGAAHAAIMRNFFGTDAMTFTIGSDEFAVNPGLGYAPDHTRTFHSFSEAAWENAMSRVWLGVHFEWDARDGNVLGTQVGDYIFANNLRAVPEPRGWAIALTAVGSLALQSLVRSRRRG